MRRCHRSFWVLGLAAAILLAPAVSRAQNDDEKKRALRAAFVRNFLKYVTWPEEAFANEDSPVVLTVIGEATAAHIQKLTEGDRVQRRPLVVQRLNPPEANAPAEEWKKFKALLAGTHAMYIDHSAERQVRKILEAIGDADVLTVSDASGFAARGGMLGLVYRGDMDKYFFEANLQAIRKTRLAVNARLLDLAKIVASK